VMKLIYKASLIFLLVVLHACSNELEQETYTIARKGMLFQDENFDVIHVYGFSGNEEVAREITDFLKQSEPKTYHYKLTK